MLVCLVLEFAGAAAGVPVADGMVVPAVFVETKISLLKFFRLSSYPETIMSS